MHVSHQRVLAVLALGALSLVGALALAAMPSSGGTPVGLAASTPIVCPTLPAGLTLHYGQTTPVVMTQIPSRLPCVGAEINDDVVLLPLAAAPGMLTSSQAVATLISSGNFTPTAGLAITGVLLTNMTIVSTLPPPTPVVVPGTNKILTWNTIQDRPVWLITTTSSTPFDAGSDGPVFPPGVTPTPRKRTFVTHNHMALDARTGAFIIGFYTK